MNSKIKVYTPREGRAPHLDIDEYGFALRKYPTKDREISEALEWIYQARTRCHEVNVERYLNIAYEKAKEAGCTLEELGLDADEFDELCLVSFQHQLSFYERIREGLLSRGLMVFPDSHVNFLLHAVESKIEYFDQQIDYIYRYRN